MDETTTASYADMWEKTPPDQRDTLLTEAQDSLELHESLASSDWWPKNGTTFAQAWSAKPFDKIPQAVRSALAITLVPKIH